MAATVMMLTAAVLLHFLTPHHSAVASNGVSAMAPAIAAESRKPHGHSSTFTLAGTGSNHHEAAVDTLARPPRAVVEETQPPSAVAVAAAVDPDTSLGASQRSRPRKARDACNPTAGTTPTNSSLQIFRC
ncbi:hypothetical protein Q5762_30375 [Streptomyces sp. P9(2023)]|uniref:hypothetical protein n=1 Tax=Streptomyces sp. P9(2023) TaxID=3064394 RepID=UPI0028F44DC1|nr:hypothetical protein [Streptomyces sp. P9(2023)]MDT9692561.1 hypothetical protein [Streptomyces sp. P9(2023)]